MVRRQLLTSCAARSTEAGAVSRWCPGSCGSSCLVVLHRLRQCSRPVPWCDGAPAAGEQLPLWPCMHRQAGVPAEGCQHSRTHACTAIPAVCPLGGLNQLRRDPSWPLAASQRWHPDGRTCPRILAGFSAETQLTDHQSSIMMHHAVRWQQQQQQDTSQWSRLCVTGPPAQREGGLGSWQVGSQPSSVVFLSWHTPQPGVGWLVGAQPTARCWR